MNPVKFGVRAGLLLAIMAGVALVVASITPSTPNHGASAAGPTLDPSVSCADVYLNFAALAAQDPSLITPGDPPAPTDPLVASSITRTEPSQKGDPNQYDITQATYLGDDSNGDLIPDNPPTKLDCQQKAEVVAGTADVTNHKLTIQKPIVEPEPYDRVDVLVNSNGEVKNMLFTCQNTNEKVLAKAPKVKNAGVDESWGATFGQKCISQTQGGVDLQINWVGAATSALKPKCVFSNTATPTQFQPCDVSNTPPTAKPAAESGEMSPSTDFAAQGNKRPTALATWDDATDILSYSTCSFSEALKVWIRTDVESKVLDKTGKGAKNFAKVVLYLATSSPTDPNDPTTCAILPDTVVFPSIAESHTRDAATDFPAAVDPRGVPKNVGIATDPDGDIDGTHGAGNLVEKFQPEVPDSADGLQDDWDGDGCTDWDELSKDQHDVGARLGSDPYNPNDCGPSEHDYTGSYTILATAFPAAKQGQITGDKAVVKQIQNKVIKDGKHIEATLLVSNIDPQVLKNNQKVYWNTDDDLQRGWWQVKYGSISEIGPQPTATPSGPPKTDKTVTLHRLFAPPCGLITAGLPAEGAEAPAPGVIQGVQCVGDTQAGQYFHCISRIDHNLINNALDSNLVCYIDAALLDTGAVPGNSDGNPGAPPPPPYGAGDPSKVVGVFDKGNQRIVLAGCFSNTGGSTGPNIIVQTSLDAKTLKGFTNIFFNQSIEDCNENNLSADPLVGPTPKGPPSLQVETTISAQDINKDHDGDGCTDFAELAKPSPLKKCGDDPYSPFDADDDVTGVSSILVTVVRADVCQGGDSQQYLPKHSFQNDPVPNLCAGDNQIIEGGGGDDLPDGTVIGGNYFQCIADTQGPNTDLTVAAFCYSNNPILTVNCEDAKNGAKVKPALCSIPASVCDPPVPGGQPPNQCGDGLPGDPPPLPYGDVDDPHTVLTGTYDKTTNKLALSGCFSGVENALLGPSVWTNVTVNGQTGQGTATIWTQQANGCPGGKPVTKADFIDAPLEMAEQPDGWDTDKDNCTNTQELRNPANAGGVRDPYNRWDWMDQWINGKTDGSIVVGDIGAVVARFGTVGTPGDPKVPPPDQFSYDTQADRGGALVGSAGPWNLKAPDGSIVVGDIGAVVAQFGHAGCAGKNP